MLTKAIREAETRVSLTALSFLPPRREKSDDFGDLFRAIRAGIKKGVEVRIIMPGSHIANPATLGNTRTGNHLLEEGCTVVLRKSPYLLHAKTAVIDHKSAWVGSGNFTAAAAHFNRECWLETDDQKCVADLLSYHDYLMMTANPRGWSEP